MRKTTLLIASCGLASGLAMAAQEQDTGAYDTDPEMTQDQSDYGTARPADPSETMGEQHEQQGTEYGTQQTDPEYQSQDRHSGQQGTEHGTQQTDPAYQSQDRQSGQHGTKDLTAMSSSELEGKAITTASGEEIGEIDEVWKSTTGDERIATVEVGGFLGIGEKTIAIPLSDLQEATSGDSYQTSMTRDTIEAHPEFDESGYDRESGQDDQQGVMEQDEDESTSY